MIINHLLNRMILQVHTPNFLPFFSLPAFKSLSQLSTTPPGRDWSHNMAGHCVFFCNKWHLFFSPRETGKCLTPTQLLICSSFSRENGHLLLICSSLSTSQRKKLHLAILRLWPFLGWWVHVTIFNGWNGDLKRLGMKRSLWVTWHVLYVPRT